MVFMDIRQHLFDFSILSWNVRGASNDTAKRHIKELIRKHKPKLIFLIETHVQFAKVRNFWQRVGYIPIHIVEAQGHYRGIWALAEVGHNLDISVWEYSNQSISLEIKSGNQKWICTGVYASPNPSIRGIFRQHLCDLNLHINTPWLLLGDWNEILLPGEKRGVASRSLEHPFLKEC